MKKVGKEFKKTLSAILVAAMVFTSLPQTTLVAKAAEEDQQVYELNGSSVVGNGESDTISPEFVVKDESGNVLNVTVSNVTVQTEKTDSSKYYVYDGFDLSDSNCTVLKVGGVEKTNNIYDEYAGYVFDKPADGEPVVVTVAYAAKTITVTDNAAQAGDAIVTFDSSTVTTTTSGESTTYKTKAGKSVKFKASVKSGVDAEVTKVEYAIGSGENTELTAKASGYYVIENATISGDIKITVTLAYKHVVEFADTNGLTIKYAPSTENDIAKFVPFTNKTSLKPGTYNFWIDAGEKTISSVKVDGTEKYPSATKVSGVTVYPVEVSAADVAVEVTTVAANKTVSVTPGTGVKAVYYYASDDAEASAPATSLFTKVTGSKIALDSTAAKLFVYAEYENNYTVNDVTINGTKVTEPAPTAETVYTVPLGADTLSVAVTAKKIEKTIVFNAVGTAENIHGKVVVEKANIVKVGTGEDAKAPTADVEITTEAKTLTVNQGDKLKFRVTANDGYEASVQQNGADVKKYVVGSDTYYEVEIKSSNDPVEVNITKILGKTVTFEANTDIDKINEYVNGATQATEKSFSTTAVPVDYNKSYKFEIKSYANEIKIVDKVSYKLEGDTKFTELTPANGVYTIDKITKNVTIKVETKLNVAKVNAFSVEFNKDEFTTVRADVIRLDEKGATVSDPIVSGKTYYVTGNDANNKVNLTITPKAGLKETVTGAKLNDAKTAYVIDFGTTKVDNADKAKVGQNVPVKVTTAVDDTAVTANQFVEFTKGTDVTLDVKGATKLTGDDYKDKFVYEIDKATKEVTFTLTVPYGKKLDYAADDTVVFKTAEPEITKAGVVYSYKILVNQVNHADKASPLTIAIGNTVDDEVAFAITGDSSKYNAYYYSGKSTFVATNGDYVVGTEIYIEITDSDYKLVQVVDDKDVDIELDAFSKYSVIISKAVTFKVVAKAEAPAAKDYTVIVDKVIFDQDTETESTTTADLTKEVLANDKFEISAKTNPQAPASPASVTFTKAAFTEEVKSTLSLNNDKSKATVVIAAEDAGKTLTVNLYADEENGKTTKKDVLVGTVEFKTAKAVASATVKDGKTAIKNGGKVTKDALTETIFDVTVAPETELSYYDVKVVSGDANVAWVNAKTKKQIKVVTPAKAESTVINIINTVTGKAIFGFTVETKLPELKLSKVDSLAQGFNKINLTLTADKNVKDAAEGAYVYYEVTVTPQEGTAPVGSAKKVLYIAKSGESQNEEITVNTATDLTKAAWKYDFEVRLVLSQTQLSDGTTAATNLVAAGKSIKKTFATKNAYYEDKLSVTKKTTTIYTGQSDVTAAVVKFSKNASYVDNVTIERVLDKDGVDRTGWFTINGGTVDNNGYEVKLGVNTTTTPGKYTVEIAAEAEKSADGTTQTMYRATATLPITVVAGINRISVDTDVRIAQTGKKDVSYTIKPVGYSVARVNGSNVKAKSQKFIYEPDYTGLNPVQEANVKKNVVVNKTNGKITIKKGFVLGNDWKDNCFKVKVTANDFTNADGSARTTAIVEFLVAPEVIEIGEIYVAPNDDDSKNLGTTLTRDQANGAQIIAKDTDGNIINDCVTFTPAFKNEKSSGVYYDSDYDNDRLFVAKAGTITVKATTTDGGKKSKSIKLTIKNKDFTSMSYEVYSVDTTVVETAQNQWNYKATTTPELILSVNDIAKDGTVTNAYMSYYNYSIKIVKGGTLVYTYSDGISFIPTAKETKVAIKVGKTTTNVTITNDTYPTAKAPKATTKDKLYKGLFKAELNNAGYAVPQQQTLTYTVNSDKYTTVSVEAVGNDPYRFGGRTYAIADQKFTLDTNNTWIGSSKYYNSGKYVFVYGEMKADKFIPATQPATVTIKAANTAAYKPVTSYKINPANSKTITLTGKPANVDVMYYDLQNANVKGQPNKFLDLFELNFDANGKSLNTLTLKTDEAAKKALEDKANYTGYVTYEYVNTSGDPVIKTTKITVSFDNKAPKYTADTKDVLKGAPTTVTTTIKLGGKAVELSANATDIVSATTGWTAVKGANAGEVLLTAAAPEIGKNKVDIKFITADSANLGTGADKNGITVTATINVIDPATSTKKVSPNKVTADLNSNTVAKSYSDVDKTGIYTIALTDTYKINVAGTVVSAMAVASNSPAGITVAFDKATDTVTFSVKANSIQAGKTVKVPVELTFDGSAAKETITFNVIAPKTIPTANTAVESVKAYLAKYYAKSDDANLQANLQKEIDAITGVKVTSVTTHFVDEVKDAQGKVTTAASYTVDVVLSNPADVTKPIELKNVAVLAPKAADPAKQDTAAKALAAVTARANTTYIVTTLSADKDTAAKQLQVSASSTRFTIRQYLQSQITGDYTLAMPSYEMKAPVDEVKDKDGNTTTAKEDGYIKFTYGVVGQTESLYYNSTLNVAGFDDPSELTTVTIVLPGKSAQ